MPGVNSEGGGVYDGLFSCNLLFHLPAAPPPMSGVCGVVRMRMLHAASNSVGL